jgi:uncharacterized protein (DUF4415 family)
MKEKIISMTAAEIRRDFNREKAVAMAKAAPEYDGDPNPDGKSIGCGFAAFKEYINKNGRPKAADPKRLVAIRLPESILAQLRSTWRGWQTRLGDYIARGVGRGMFGATAAMRKS